MSMSDLCKKILDGHSPLLAKQVPTVKIDSKVIEVKIPLYMHQWIMDLCVMYDKKFDEIMPDIIAGGISVHERQLLRSVDKREITL